MANSYYVVTMHVVVTAESTQEAVIKATDAMQMEYQAGHIDGYARASYDGDVSVRRAPELDHYERGMIPHDKIREHSPFEVKDGA